MAQGRSATKIIDDVEYTFENWVYVVLSRVRKRAGLVLNTKLDLKRDFKVPERLF